MTEECEYQMGELCFHPEKATQGFLAVPCSECGLCNHSQQSRIVKDAKLEMAQQVKAIAPATTVTKMPSEGRFSKLFNKITSRKPIALEE